MHPFENQIMRDPETRPPGSVVSYNQEHLDALHHRLLERIDAEDNLNQALVLLSTNPGFGKTHLLARLIETTRGFCVPVFVPPTNAGRNYGGAVLDRVVSRLLALPVGSGNGSRLDWLTFQLISQVCEDAATTRLWREFNLTNLDETDFQVGLLAQRPALISSLTRFLPDLTRHQLLEPPGIWATALMESYKA